jgi:tetraacyldisaccharide 4'-kinase
LASAAVSLLCAIAQPEGFRRAVAAAGGAVRETLAYPDHHPFTGLDLTALDMRLGRASATQPEWIATEKDAIKLRGRLQAADRLWVLEMEVVPDEAARAFFFDSLQRLAIK